MAVTPESNLALIEELQELVGASTYEPVDGPEFSYPAVGQAVDDEMWKYITLALGDGVLDEGGQPYWLRKLASDSETNSANQMRLTVSTTRGDAQAVLKGFYHRLLQNMRLDFPMPLSETTYYVVLELNPLKARDPEGPISVKVYPNELNTESGRRHLLLWTVTRKPNELLTDAKISRIRPKVTPVISVDEPEHRPDPSTVLWGTRCFVTSNGIEYRAQGSSEDGPRSWYTVGKTKGWTDIGLGGSYRAHSITPQYRVADGYVEFRGNVRNTGGSALPTEEYKIFGWVAGDIVLPDFNAMQHGTNGRRVAITTSVGSSGVRNNLTFNTRDSGVTWFALDGIRMPIEE